MDAIQNPSKPVLNLEKVGILDENQDGLLSPGESINFQFQIRNTSKVPAENVKIRLMAPTGIQVNSESIHVPSLPEGITSVTGPKASLLPELKAGTQTLQIELAYLEATPDGQPMQKEFSITVDKDYLLQNYSLESMHDYSSNSDLHWIIEKSNAKSFRIHFQRIALEPGYDLLSIFDSTGKEIALYDGFQDDFWTPEIPNSSAHIQLTSDDTNNYYGFKVDKIAYIP